MALTPDATWSPQSRKVVAHRLRTGERRASPFAN
jgi:hypothetical protein